MFMIFYNSAFIWGDFFSDISERYIATPVGGDKCEGVIEFNREQNTTSVKLLGHLINEYLI